MRGGIIRAMSEGEGKVPSALPPSPALHTRGDQALPGRGAWEEWGWAQRGSGLRLCLLLEMWAEPGVPSPVPL